VVEHLLGKEEVAGSSPVVGPISDPGGSIQLSLQSGLCKEMDRPVAQLVEHRSPKPAVVGSSPTWPATFTIYPGSQGWEVKMFGRISTLLGEVRSEMLKVTWPTRDELTNSTSVVLTVSAAMAVFIFFADAVLSFVMNQILN
jgi:preprotein translocase subunit SecE